MSITLSDLSMFLMGLFIVLNGVRIVRNPDIVLSNKVGRFSFFSQDWPNTSKARRFAISFGVFMALTGLALSVVALL